MELPVEPASGALSVALEAALDVTGGMDPQNADGGDQVKIAATVSNTGNIALSDVRPADFVVMVGGVRSTVSSLAIIEPEVLAEIGPGASGEFAITYVLSDEDVYRAAGTEDGLVVRGSATARWAVGEIAAELAEYRVQVPANPRLTIAKGAAIAKAEGNRGAGLEAGDIVTYTYTVTNSGNVAISDITITDEHEGVLLNSAEAASIDEGPFAETESVADPLGVSADESGPNGVWDLLGAGGAVTFTYRHTVTQAEFEAQ
ncbi:DUF7507 domain-containing protein [Oricola thermophila]|uniref:DUF7507 domain-containing protein n=1 Tax=Oricola thermophila TaxID=2742145 RepID=A0A6N1VA72_9HYPH|nr:hypothetical protein [Oricola thermophila]QKV17433.1 hypothetical protein HTY61_02600 [Oricola thermophila]